MPAQALASRFFRTAVVGALALGLSPAGFAIERTTGVSITVTVLADRYLAAGVSFPDLETLDALVRPMNAHLVRLEACGPAASDALLAAADHLSYAPLVLNVLPPTAPQCAAAPVRAVQVSQAGGPIPVGAARIPSDRYWRSVMP